MSEKTTAFLATTLAATALAASVITNYRSKDSTDPTMNPLKVFNKFEPKLKSKPVTGVKSKVASLAKVAIPVTLGGAAIYVSYRSGYTKPFIDATWESTKTHAGNVASFVANKAESATNCAANKAKNAATFAANTWAHVKNDVKQYRGPAVWKTGKFIVWTVPKFVVHTAGETIWNCGKFVVYKGAKGMWYIVTGTASTIGDAFKYGTSASKTNSNTTKT